MEEICFHRATFRTVYTHILHTYCTHIYTFYTGVAVATKYHEFVCEFNTLIAQGTKLFPKEAFLYSSCLYLWPEGRRGNEACIERIAGILYYGVYSASSVDVSDDWQVGKGKTNCFGGSVSDFLVNKEDCSYW